MSTSIPPDHPVFTVDFYEVEITNPQGKTWIAAASGSYDHKDAYRRLVDMQNHAIYPRLKNHSLRVVTRRVRRDNPAEVYRRGFMNPVCGGII